MIDALDEPATPAALTLSQSCQTAVGMLVGESDHAWPDLAVMATLFAAVPAPRTYCDALHCAVLLERFLDRAAHELHGRLHAGAIPASCSFDVTRCTCFTTVDQVHPESWNATAIFRAWAATFVAGLRDRHHGLVAELALCRLRGPNGSAVTVSALARELACSVPVLQRRFAQTTGQSLRQYVIRLRVSRAIDLLRTTDLKVDTITREVGWRSKKDLHAAFVRLIDITPGGLRQLNEEAANDLRRRLQSARHTGAGQRLPSRNERLRLPY